MRKILFISLFAIVFIAACKKEAIETKDPAALDLNNMTTNAPYPCSGNNWKTESDPYPYTHHNAYVPPVVYNNQVYKFGYGDVKIYNGTSWSSVTTNIPYNYTGQRFFNFTFVIGNKGYLSVTSATSGPDYIDFFEYDFDANTWQQKADYPAVASAWWAPAVFTIGNKAYVVGGKDPSNNGKASNDTWEYDQPTDTWTQKADIPDPSVFGTGIFRGTGFSIDGKGYVVNGAYYSSVLSLPGGGAELSKYYTNKLFQYNPSTDTWSTKASFPGQARDQTSAFVISGKAYAGGGYGVNGRLHDFFKYNPVTNSWLQIASVTSASANPGYILKWGFSINSKGYACEIWDVISSEGILYKYTPQYCNPGSSQ
jgi:Galactose oxidase, central domain